MPQLSAEISTMEWLYSVMNKGEGAMNAMNMNIPIRVREGGIEEEAASRTPGVTLQVDGTGNMRVVHPDTNPTLPGGAPVPMEVNADTNLGKRKDPPMMQTQRRLFEDEAGPSTSAYEAMDLSNMDYAALNAALAQKRADAQLVYDELRRRADSELYGRQQPAD